MGEHRGHAPTRLLESQLRHPGTADHGLHRHRRHAVRGGRPATRTAPPTQRAGADGPPHGCRRPPGRVRPAVRALRRAAPSAPGPAAQPDPIGPLRPGLVRSPPPNVSTYSTLNERTSPPRPTSAWPSPLVDYTVSNPRPLLRAESDTGAVVMEGDATGLNNLAGLGLLSNDNAIYYAGTLAGDPLAAPPTGRPGRQLVLTDTNRKQAFQWASMTANTGFTETPSDDPAKTDPRDSPIELFPGGARAADGGVVRGSGQHHRQQLRKRHHLQPRVRRLQRHRRRLRHGLDHGHLRPRPGRPVVAGAIRDTVTTNHITLVQPQRGDRSRWISSVTVTFDGKDPEHFQLTNASHLGVRADAHVSHPVLSHAARDHRQHDRRPPGLSRPPRPSASPRSRSRGRRCAR